MSFLGLHGHCQYCKYHKNVLFAPSLQIQNSILNKKYICYFFDLLNATIVKKVDIFFMPVRTLFKNG